MGLRGLTACLIGSSLVACAGAVGDEQNPRSAEVRISEDIVYGHKFGLAMVFNVFRPDEPNGLGVIFINSGGWNSPFRPFVTDSDDGGRRLLTREELDELHSRWGEFHPQWLLERGYTVFEVRHGSSPRFVVPEIVADLRRAVRFIRYHAAEYGVDPERLGLWGGSAGGHLSLMLGLASEVGNSEESDPIESASGGVAALVSYFPVSDMESWAPEMVNRFPAVDHDPAEYPEYSPIRFVSGDDPPTLIIHGDQDELIPLDQGQSVYEALLATGVTTELIVIEGADHGFQAADAVRAAEAMVAWFDEHLGN